MTIAALLVSMIGHPLRHRLGLIDLRVPGHEDEEREVDDAEDARGVRVSRRRGLQAEIAERDEADREREQEALDRSSRDSGSTSPCERSSHGRKKNASTAAPISITPNSLLGTARRIA